MYSILRATISIKHNVDIKNFSNLIAFLKRQGEGYRSKKSKVLTKEDFNNFLLQADDQMYLALKVILIVRVSGGCRKDELLKDELLIDNVEDLGSCFKICISDTKTKRSRTFVITKGLVEIVRKYTSGGLGGGDWVIPPPPKNFSFAYLFLFLVNLVGDL
ncbi:hypothetical protein RI129_007183 [Pyrocoelia pectoralis]|uniref:Uncharacterized protein n=1 Tax=Pyrocoelia pectoralis TaxID=417401 RepID=A0AAN7VDL1_9COLE